MFGSLQSDHEKYLIWLCKVRWGDRKIGRKDRFSKWPLINKCEVSCFALVLKRSFLILNLFFSKNKQDICVPWHPFDVKLTLLNLGCQGLTNSDRNTKLEVLDLVAQASCEALSTSQKIDSSEYHCWIITIINVFLCQSDKERHVRIGEIVISPILKLFRETCWITSWLIEITQHGGGLRSAAMQTGQGSCGAT